MLYLHERGIVHGDLKGNNVVVGSDGKAKVTDFGLSSAVSQSDEARVQITGAWHWVAPECLAPSDACPTLESDVYALGMCIIEAVRVVEAVRLKTDESESPPLPWRRLDNIVIKGHVLKRELPSRPSICTDDQWALVERMCRFDPSTRLKIVTVVEALAKLATAN